jgi:hypothetical protein
MHIIRTILIISLIMQPCFAAKSNGHLVELHPKLAPPRKPLQGSCSVHICNVKYQRGLIGCVYDLNSGRIEYIYPDSNLLKAGVHEGDYILKINKQARRPCLMPMVAIYPAGYNLELEMLKPDGTIYTVKVKLIDANKIVGDSQ